MIILPRFASIRKNNYMSFLNFGFSDAIMAGVEASGYKTPTPIQQAVIPLVLDQYDVIGCAPTGTGKTAAFALPIIEILINEYNLKRVKNPKALILAPTRELAIQINECFNFYKQYAGVRSTVIYGGVSIGQQIRELKKGTHIVIATPGRLLDIKDRGCIDLSEIDMLVLDEADRMYDMGFINDVREIIESIPDDRQTLLFSATIQEEIYRLISEIQRPDAKYVEIGKSFVPVEQIRQQAISVPAKKKQELLEHLIRTENVQRMLVFSRTKHGADRIANSLLRGGISSSAIHSDRSQSQRHQALEGFKQQQFRVLVATDVAARGIDVKGITHVVNYDTPVFAEDYIHRIGRTGRAEAEGIALTFVSPDEEQYLKRIQYFTGKKLGLTVIPGFEDDEALSKEKVPFFETRKRSYYRKPSFAR